jgi:hypothetical protein
MEDLAVKCYAGYKYPEKPKSFTYLGRDYLISEIVKSYHEEKGGERRFVYLVKTEEGEKFTLIYDLTSTTWSLG